MARKKVCPPPGTRKYGTKSRYTKENLEKALDDIKNAGQQNAGVVQYQQINPPSPIEVVEIYSGNIEDVEGNYQNHDGILERVDLNEKKDAKIGSVSTDKDASKVSLEKENRKQDYCVVKYEDILFPGRIICREGDTAKISVMQKSQDGWKWPLKRDLITCQQKNIVSFLDDQKIIKLKDYYLVDDPLLFMEWGN